MATDTPTTDYTETPVPTVVTETPTPDKINWKGLFVYDMNEFVHQVPVIMPEGLDPLGTVERHVMPSDPYTAPYSFLPFYIACNYYALPDNVVCADTYSDIIGGDPLVYLGRPEYKIDVYRNGNEYSTQLFSDGRPMKAGWQNWIELPEGVVASHVTLTFDIQLWTNPVFSGDPPYPITEYSKPAIMPEGDDIRAVEFFTFVSDEYYMRDPDWIEEVYYGDPTGVEWLRYTQSEETYTGLEVNEMPYDHWNAYVSEYTLDQVTDNLYFGLGVLSRFGWGTNFYVRSIVVEIDGYSNTVVPTETPIPTPTPRVSE